MLNPISNVSTGSLEKRKQMEKESEFMLAHGIAEQTPAQLAGWRGW